MTQCGNAYLCVLLHMQHLYVMAIEFSNDRTRGAEMTTLTFSFADNLRHAVSALFAAFDDAMNSVYKANGLVRDLEKIMDTSDEALAEQGLTRQEALRQAAANRGYF